jgi:hypothetical protein
MYAGYFGPQYLDLSWQPQSTAETPSYAQVLFDRMQPQEIEAVSYERAQPKVETVHTQTLFFWAMAPIAAKYIARRNVQAADGMLRMLDDTLQYVGAEHRQAEPATQPTEQLRTLRQMCTDMEDAMPGVDSEVARDPRVPAQVRIFLDLVEQMLDEQYQ